MYDDARVAAPWRRRDRATSPAAAARPYLGAWVRNDSLAPTFDRRLLSYAPHFHEAQMGRNRKCDTGHDTSWRWAWFACRVPFPVFVISDG